MFVMVFLRNSWLLTELVKQPPSTADTNPNHFSARPRGEREGEPGTTASQRWPQTAVLEERLDRAEGGTEGGGEGGEGEGGGSRQRVSAWFPCGRNPLT